MTAHRLLRPCLALFLVVALAAPALALDYGSTVVTVKVTTQGYDHYSPWRKGPLSQQEIQGCVLDGRLILTVAGPLMDHALVEVSKNGSPRKYTAEVVLKDYVAGLALLTVRDPSFFTGTSAAPLADSGAIQGQIHIARWEAGGILREFSASLVKTSVDYFTPLGATLAHFLTTEMPSGGFGEPVFLDGKLLGLAYYLEPASKNLKVFAVEAVRRLLADYSDGSYQGYPSTWEYARTLDGDTNLKSYLGMAEDETGVLITAVPPRMSGAGILQPDDVLLEVEGRGIDDSGLFRHPTYGMLHYECLLFLGHVPGDTITVRILRQRQHLELTIPLFPLDSDAFLIPMLSADEPPQYLVFGGLVFQELTRSYLQGAWGNDWWRSADSRLLFLYDERSLFPQEKGQRTVILNRVLPHAANVGYQSEGSLVLEKLGGVPISNLADLADKLAASKERFAVFEFAGGDRMVLSYARAAEAEKEIMSNYGIPTASVVRREPEK